jgi:hypothetical protein
MTSDIVLDSILDRRTAEFLTGGQQTISQEESTVEPCTGGLQEIDKMTAEY